MLAEAGMLRARHARPLTRCMEGIAMRREQRAGKVLRKPEIGNSKTQDHL